MEPTRNITAFLAVLYALHRYVIILTPAKWERFNNVTGVSICIAVIVGFNYGIRYLLHKLVDLEAVSLTRGPVLSSFFVEQSMTVFLSAFHAFAVSRINRKLGQSIAFLRGLLANEQVRLKIKKVRQFVLFNRLTLVGQLSQSLVETLPELLYVVHWIWCQYHPCSLELLSTFVYVSGYIVLVESLVEFLFTVLFVTSHALLIASFYRVIADCRCSEDCTE